MEKRDNRWVPGKGRQRDRYPIDDTEKNQPIPLANVRSWLLAPANKQRLEDHLDWYLTRYEGRQFEWFAALGRGRQFTSFHILAAESLSVNVPSSAARWLLEPDGRRNDLLEVIHHSLVSGSNTLWSCDVALLKGNKMDLKSSGALYELYWNLRTLGTYDFTRGGIGQVTTSKLLAAMFPGVVPIRDSMVEALLSLSDGDKWWLMARKLLEDDGGLLVQFLDGLRTPEGSGELTILRRLDIVLWMEANARKFVS